MFLSTTSAARVCCLGCRGIPPPRSLTIAWCLRSVGPLTPTLALQRQLASPRPVRPQTSEPGPTCSLPDLTASPSAGGSGPSARRTTRSQSRQRSAAEAVKWPKTELSEDNFVVIVSPGATATGTGGVRGPLDHGRINSDKYL